MANSRGSRSCVTRSKRATLTAALALGVTLASVARAQSDIAASQALFDEGKALMAAGKTVEACPKFEESQRLDPASGTLVNLAKCYEDTGRLASAWSRYIEAAIAAKAAGNIDRESGARQRAAALASRVPKLAVNVPPEARIPGLEIARDGIVIGPAQWGLAIPVDEGDHTIVATAPEHKEWKTVVVVKGEATTADISVPKLDESARVQTAAPVAPLPQSNTAIEPSPGLSTQRIAALAAGGIGVIGVAVGTVFGLKTMSNQSVAEKYCVDTTCSDQRGVTAGNDAHSAGNVATIGMVVGAVGLTTGLTLWFTASNGRSSTDVGIGPGTVHVEGVW